MADGVLYWLKLKRDFFKRHDIRIVESMPNGKDYVLFYLKLLCESLDHEGSLRFSDTIPYSDEMLAALTSTNVDIVRSAVKVFVELHMMEMLDDGTLFMTELHKMTGQQADNANANRQRRFRENHKGDAVTEALQERYGGVTESNESIEYRDKRLESRDENLDTRDTHSNVASDIQSVMDAWNSIGLTTIREIKPDSTRGKMTKARLREYGLDEVLRAIELVRNSSFLMGNGNRGWQATYDWFIAPSNFQKVVEGTYIRNEQPKQQPKMEVQTDKGKSEMAKYVQRLKNRGQT